MGARTPTIDRICHPVQRTMAPHRWTVGLTVLALACSDDVAQRPLELELVGLVARSETVVVKLAQPSQVPPCDTLTPEGAAQLPAEQEVRWSRGSGQPRSLQLPGLNEENVAIVVVVFDELGVPIQVGCEVFNFPEIERPEVEIVLR